MGEIEQMKQEAEQLKKQIAVMLATVMKLLGECLSPPRGDVQGLLLSHNLELSFLHLRPWSPLQFCTAPYVLMEIFTVWWGEEGEGKGEKRGHNSEKEVATSIVSAGGQRVSCVLRTSSVWEAAGVLPGRRIHGKGVARGTGC